MKVLLAVAGAVAIWGVATVLVVDKLHGPAGAETPQAAADHALRAISDQDKGNLLDVADPELHGREAAAERLIDNCRGADFEGARAGVPKLNPSADHHATTVIVVPRGQGECRTFPLSLQQRQRGWFVSLSTPDPNRAPIPTSATDR
ncbi:hypothetical protein HPO96_14920 [Kribbella sandramycini]|uniref:Uncharacterized protein n=1 Tax=Kribbella sandramycini TaxID=60450 RepID=A0A7Y4NZ13_9ACTN|nr:hypothetical protein [Kribbella sandramycini]MBB6565268.1 hypothetical protein [Kribbella sandramycini]NOL41537.1 hypothetical protein [Kribbella sandramycini]